MKPEKPEKFKNILVKEEFDCTMTLKDIIDIIPNDVDKSKVNITSSYLFYLIYEKSIINEDYDKDVERYKKLLLEEVRMMTDNDKSFELDVLSIFDK
jgi:hypothetical protein